MALNIEFLQQQFAIDKFNTIWIGFSGGQDSTALLHLAAKAFNGHKTVKAIHINHNLNKAATAWQQHCQIICNQLEIPLVVKSIAISSCKKFSLEEAARIARRNCWQQLLGENDIILLAHHVEDQAETILYRLFRGTGPYGLQGMHQLSKLGLGYIGRPLLNVNKQEIIDYITANQLIYIEDDSNNNIQFDRNYIRHSIMPMIKKRWPTASVNIARAGKLCQELVDHTEVYINQQIDEARGQVKNTLSIKKLLALSNAVRRNILRAWLHNNLCFITYDKLYTIEVEVMRARQDACPMLKIGDFYIRRYRDDLYIVLKNYTKQDANANVNFIKYWDGSKPLILPNNRQLILADSSGKELKAIPEQMQGKLLKVQLGGGEGSGCGKKAKKIFQQFAIPPWLRREYPLIFLDNKLISIVGLKQFKCGSDLHFIIKPGTVESHLV